MTAEILGVCKKLKRRIDAEKEKLKSLRLMIDSVTKEIDGLPNSKQFATSQVEKIVGAIIDTENLIFQLIKIKADCTLELGGYLEKMTMDSAARQVLLYRYGLCLPFADIARRFGFTRRRIFQIHSAALNFLHLSFT